MYYQILIVNIKYIQSNFSNLLLSSRTFSENVNCFFIQKCNSRIKETDSKKEIIFLSKYVMSPSETIFGHLESAKIFIQRHPESIYKSLTFIASIDVEIKIVKYLVEKGANIHADNDQTLIFASWKGDLEVIKYLVKHGAYIHAKDDQALKIASLKGRLEVVKYLVELGANIHAKDDEALINASINGHLEVIEYLVKKGANIHTKNDIVLKYASGKGHLEIVKYFKSRGLN